MTSLLLRAAAAWLVTSVLFVACPGLAMAQSRIAVPVSLDPVVVTASKRVQRSFDTPASIDVVDGGKIREGQPASNLSESMVRVPGVFVANRNNYAQDIQVSSRGYGGRATFGVRGVRLYQDFIPVTMPDGQGQTGSFNLLTVKRIEVLRGPFSTQYGNASGGVISVFTEDPGTRPAAGFSISSGSDGTQDAGVMINDAKGAFGYLVAADRFETTGYRAHSAARRTVANTKLTFASSDRSRITIIATSQHQPDSEDPLGLSQAQVDADRRQATGVAGLFGTRKSIDLTQGGIAWERELPASALLRLVAYGGQRGIRQYLGFAGDAATSSGGVVDLDRGFSGLGVRLMLRGDFANTPWLLSMGVDTDRMREKRRGFVNDFGRPGALRRDEDDAVTSRDAYAQLDWDALRSISLSVGVRASHVGFKSADHYIVAANPDDSGSRRYANTSPIAGLVWHATKTLNAYASYGQGFETPTFAEIAYRSSGAGLNLALEPARSASVEVGLKWLPKPGQRINVALFGAHTDHEIMVDNATGGRTTFRNAGRTTRHGLELVWDGTLGAGFEVHANYSWVKATFNDSVATAMSASDVPTGARLPGVPAHQSYGELDWSPGGHHGLTLAAEVQHVGRVYANDRNTASAAPYTIGNLRAGFAQANGKMRWNEYVRVNNVTNARYIGSVIVGDSNGRYFEPAQGRTWSVGMSLDLALH